MGVKEKNPFPKLLLPNSIPFDPDVNCFNAEFIECCQLAAKSLPELPTRHIPGASNAEVEW